MNTVNVEVKEPSKREAFTRLLIRLTKAFFMGLLGMIWMAMAPIFKKALKAIALTLSVFIFISLMSKGDAPPGMIPSMVMTVVACCILAGIIKK